MVQIYKHPSSPKAASCLTGEIDELLLADVFQALADPTRNKLLSCLAKCGRPCSVGELAECCSVDMSVVSRHLGVLANARIIESEKQGRTVYYKVKFQHLSQMFRDLALAFEDCEKGRHTLVKIRQVK